MVYRPADSRKISSLFHFYFVDISSQEVSLEALVKNLAGKL